MMEVVLVGLHDDKRSRMPVTFVEVATISCLWGHDLSRMMLSSWFCTMSTSCFRVSFGGGGLLGESLANLHAEAINRDAFGTLLHVGSILVRSPIS